ncbi:MAG: hypothetical protein PHR35_10625 [Kiritimatiellae bacterium]|nr:hypothetical protein [Kiritimatiellia bacterium]
METNAKTESKPIDTDPAGAIVGTLAGKAATSAIPCSAATIRLADRKELLVEIDGETGNIVHLKDRAIDLTVIDQPPLWELQVNRHPVQPKLYFHEDRRGILQTIGRVTSYQHYCQGWGLKVARLAVPSQHGLHLQYRIWREPMEHNYPTPGPTVHGLEMPLWVDSLGFLGWRFPIMKPDTRMRICHLTGGGPVEHTSAEDGPMAEVNPRLWHLIRRTYPGGQSIPGVLYYRADPAQWLFIFARRSNLAYTADFNEHGIQFHMQYHKFLEPLGEFPVPEISLLWGRDLDEMETIWAGQFDQYEEPPDWLYHTVWTSNSCAGADPRKFGEVADAAVASIEHGGANGFWLYSHDIKRFDTDTSPSGAGPCPNSGTRREFKEMVKRIHGAGGKVQIWLSSCGMKPWGDMRMEWSIRGADGKPWVSWGWDAHEFITACSPLNPAYRRYMLDWTRRYVEDFDVDAFFLDCGIYAFPCDFSASHPGQVFPSEVGPAFRSLFVEMWDLAQSIKPGNFHMWYEGLHCDYPGSGYCHGNMTFPPPPPDVMTGQRMLYNLVRHGKRLVWGTLKAFDLACGSVHWNPPMGGPLSVEDTIKCAQDPMNRFIVKLVTERGVRDARGITDGLSRLDEYLVTVPDYHGTVTLVDPTWHDIRTVENVFTGEKRSVCADFKGQPTLDLAGGTAYRIV